MKVKIFIDNSNDGEKLTAEINSWLTANRNIKIIERDMRACAAEVAKKEHYNNTRVVVAIWYE